MSRLATAVRSCPMLTVIAVALTRSSDSRLMAMINDLTDAIYALLPLIKTSSLRTAPAAIPQTADAVTSRPRQMPPVEPIVTGEVEARLIALACSTPPQGYARADARFTIPTPALLSRVIDMLDGIQMNDHDTNGDRYEYTCFRDRQCGRQRPVPHTAPQAHVEQQYLRGGRIDR